MPKQKLILIGARIDGHAGVVLDVIRDHGMYEPVGFIDDSPSLRNTMVAGLPVLGGINDFLDRVDFEGAYFVCGGDNKFRDRCYHLLRKRGLAIANIIHPSAVISRSVKIGEGIFIGQQTVINNNVQIGDGVLINTAATIDHDNILEDFVNVSPGCHTSGRVRLKKNCFLGTGAIVIPDITIGERAIVGAGAVVINDVSDDITVVGVPARKIKENRAYSINEGGDIMKKDIRLLRPRLHDFELFSKRAKEIFDSGCLTNQGPFVQKFEQEIKDYLGVPSVVVSNGTLAIMLALKSAGIKGKVIVPSFTFCATAHAVVWAGLEPVFVDIDPETFNLDPAKVRAAITPEVKAILAVHVFGNPCAIDELAALAKEHNLALFFDAAHAFGSTYKKQKIGSFGLAETFSTHATKPFMAVEGGIISTKDQVLLEHLQKSRNFGVDSPIDTAFIGTNAKMSELHALVGLDSLSYYPANLNKRKELVRSYQEKLRDLPGLRFQKIQENSQSSYFFFSIVLDPVKFGANRDELAVALEQAGVQTRKYFYLPLHQQKSYKGYVTGCLPHTEAVASNILCLPTHTELTFDDVSYICDIIKKLQSEKKPAVSPAQLSESKNELFSSYSYLSDDNIKRVLVTGGAGYVGCVLVKKLLEKGYQVRVLDKLIFGKEPLAEFANNPNFDLQVGPVEDKYILEKCLKGVDAVIHLAGLSNDPSCEIDSELTRKENIEATKILLEMCKGRSVKRFIFASSCSVYGFTGDIVVTEESIPNPLTAYARSKIDCEKLILPAADKNFTTVCLRKATIYGPSPRMRFDLVINAMTGTALSEGKITINGGEQWRPHLHVEDAAEVYLFMLEAEKAKISGQVFNIGSNHQNIKIADLAKRISRIIPNASVEQSDNPDKRSYNACFDKINSLGWKAQRDVEDGVLGVKKLFDEGHIKDFRDLNYFNIKRLYTYLNI